MTSSSTDRSAVFFRPGASLYQVSALLMLLGGYLNLHDVHGRPLTVAIRDVFTTHLLYEVALVLAIAFLHRFRGEVRDTLVLLAVLGAFLVDGLLVQHLYGWEPGAGMLAAAIGAGSSILLLAAVASILRLPLLGRACGSVGATVLFVRFAPALLVGSEASAEVAPAYVALGWLLAVLPLAAWLPSTQRGGSRLPLLALERSAVFGSLGFALLHFVNAGRSFNLPLQAVYLAPFVVILAPALERLLPERREEPAWGLVMRALPYLGLALGASAFPPGLLAWRWAQAWPLTPFYLALLLAAVVQVHRAARDRNMGLGHLAALLSCLAVLGGDFPEILTAARFPRLAQVLLVSAIVWCTIAWARRVRPAVLLQAASGFVAASWIAERGYPWLAAYLLTLGWGGLAIEALSGWVLGAMTRLGLAATVTVLPVLVMLAEPDSKLKVAIAALGCGAAFGLGRMRRDRLLLRLAPAAALSGLIGYPVALRHGGDLTPGGVVTDLAFATLAIAVLQSLYGGRLREEWHLWREEAAETARPNGAAVASAVAPEVGL